MSERELMKADGALRDAHRDVTLARLRLDDLHQGVSMASTALSEAELYARGLSHGCSPSLPRTWVASAGSVTRRPLSAWRSHRT